MDLNDKPCCNECGSNFIASSSAMMSMCAECAHIIYEYPKCDHKFDSGYCLKCGWDGSVSEYVQGLKAKTSKG